MTAQVGRTGLENTLRTGSDWVVKQMHPKIVNALANAFRNGKNIYGASAANNVSKLLRGHVAVAIVVTTIMSVDDFIALFNKEISGKQAFKNICKISSGVAGGAGGMWAGAALGAKVGALTGPQGVAVGSVAGGIVGGLAGGFGVSKAAGFGLDQVIEEDSVDIGRLVEVTFGRLADELLLTEREAKDAIDAFSVLNWEKTIFAIHAAQNREQYVDDLIRPFFERILARRPPVFCPSKKKVAMATDKLLTAMESEMTQEVTIGE